jgi:hypothetical protein
MIWLRFPYDSTFMQSRVSSPVVSRRLLFLSIAIALDSFA